MAENLDLRIQKTYAALSQAFYALLEERPFEEITVSELCGRAMVRRATFYKHFADKNEFFAFFLRQIQARMNEGLPSPEDTEPFAGFYLRIAGHVIGFMEANEKLVARILQSATQLTLVEILSEELHRELLGKLRREEKQGIPHPAPPGTMAAFYVGALMYTVRVWVLSPARPSGEALLGQLREILAASGL